MISYKLKKKLKNRKDVKSIHTKIKIKKKKNSNVVIIELLNTYINHQEGMIYIL